MSNKIKLLNVSELKTDDKIEANTDYGILLIASRISTEIPDTFDDKESKDDFVYRLKVERIDAIYDLKKKTPIEFTHGKTSSQKYRWRVEQKLSKDEYDYYMSWLLGKVDEHTDNYLEDIKKI